MAGIQTTSPACVIEKNKWYDFRVLFRRDKNFWDYNLSANPLNPAALNPPGSLTTGCYVGPPTAAFPQGAPAFCSNPAVAQNKSLASLDLVRRMQDYDLTLLPLSKVSFRLGYSRNRDEGPGLFHNGWRDDIGFRSRPTAIRRTPIA